MSREAPETTWHCRGCGAGAGVHRGPPPAEHVCKPADVARWERYRLELDDYHASLEFARLMRDGQLTMDGLGGRSA